MRIRHLFLLMVIALLAGLLSWVALASSFNQSVAFFPAIYKAEPTATPTATPTAQPPPQTMVEFRGLWVTRFDWDEAPNPAKIDQIVDEAAYAGFNAIFFQVRGEADAFYRPGPEPWSRFLSGTLGQDPGWDPLAHMIQKAHGLGIQVHAYINVYPVWLPCNSLPPSNTSPQHFYYGLLSHHGSTIGKPNGLQWDRGGNVVCSYQRATPASVFADEHFLNVAGYLADNYAIDGLHLDHIRYAGGDTSCDPVSREASGVDCFTEPPSGYSSYGAWQRRQVNGTVSKFYDKIILTHPGLWLSAAVWPIYKNYWGWPGNPKEGFYDYYQDSKEWVQKGYIDSISPMIYGSSFWTFPVWQTLVDDFQATNGGRYIIPGIGSNHYGSFQEIADRINHARAIGTAGHAIFSYGGLKQKGYFDDLANGPYATPAVVPGIPWHP